MANFYYQIITEKLPISYRYRAERLLRRSIQ